MLQNEPKKRNTKQGIINGPGHLNNSNINAHTNTLNNNNGSNSNINTNSTHYPLGNQHPMNKMAGEMGMGGMRGGASSALNKLGINVPVSVL